MQVNRFEIKYNFLRRIILRLDYEGVVEVKSWLETLHEKLHQYGFVKMREEFMREEEFQLQDPAVINNQKYISLNELKNTTTYKYLTEDEDIILEINKYFITLTIHPEKYKSFEQYRDILIYLISEVKKNARFMSVKRLGLRKINDCLLLDQDKLDTIFNEEVFMDVSKRLLKKEINSQMVNSRLLDTITIDKFFYNYNRSCTEGLIRTNDGEFPAYQAVLDIDGYLQDQELLKQMLEKESGIKNTLDMINDYLFKLYLASLKKTFIEDLRSEDFFGKYEYLLGVRKND